MRRFTHCMLCGRLLTEDQQQEYDGWRAQYCCRLCYETDMKLPKPEKEVMVFQVSRKIMMARYSLLVDGEQDSIYHEDFDEEEDDIMRDDDDQE